jgi:CubicO group peptidase (beta-lactamase class C family)
MSLRLLAALALLLAVTGPLHAGDEFGPLAARITRFKQATAPFGTAVAVVKNGRILYAGNFGLADIASATPVTADTRFYIASLTKPLFALDVLLQQQRGQLQTGMSLQQMLPDLRVDAIDSRQVTLRELLVHTAGLANPDLDWASAYSGLADATTGRALLARTHANPDAAHGRFDYDNLGYVIASLWLEQATGSPWQRRLDADVLQPLGMRHTSAAVDAARATGWPIAQPYSWAAPDARQPLYLHKADATMHAGGGLVATAGDLALLLAAELGAASALPAPVIADSQRVQVAVDARYLDFARDGYAWGWYAGPYKGHRMLHHFGAFAGFHAHLSFIPDAGIGLVVLNNEDMLAPRLTAAIADAVYGQLLGEPDSEAASTARFASLTSDASTARNALLARRQAIADRPWALTLPRPAYAGRYTDPLLGTVAVDVAADGTMQLRWGRLQAQASGSEQRDHVRVELVPNQGVLVGFATDGAAVTALTLDGMRFVRAH